MTLRCEVCGKRSRATLWQWLRARISGTLVLCPDCAEDVRAVGRRWT